MNYELQIKYEDYKAALRLSMRPRRSLRIILYFILALSFFGVIIISNQVLQGDIDFGTFIFFGCIFYLIIFFGAILPYRWKKLYQQQKFLQQPHQYQFTNDAFITTSEFGNNTLPWKMFHKWKEGNKMFLIYQTDVLFHIIPKRIFHGREDEQAVRNILYESIGKPMT